MFSFLGIKKYLIGGIAIVAIATSGFFYVQNLRSQIDALETRSAVLSASNETLEQTLDETREARERQSERVSTLQEKLQESERESNELRRILLDHDLTNLALNKPGLIERRVNDATQDVFDSFESITSR
jgi:uncharacterized coiled-coil protein SlyX